MCSIGLSEAERVIVTVTATRSAELLPLAAAQSRGPSEIIALMKHVPP